MQPRNSKADALLFSFAKFHWIFLRNRLSVDCNVITYLTKQPLSICHNWLTARRSECPNPPKTKRISFLFLLPPHLLLFFFPLLLFPSSIVVVSFSSFPSSSLLLLLPAPFLLFIFFSFSFFLRKPRFSFFSHLHPFAPPSNSPLQFDGAWQRLPRQETFQGHAYPRVSVSSLDSSDL